MQECFSNVVMIMVFIVFGILFFALIAVVIQFVRNKDKLVQGPRLIYICGIGGLFSLIIAALAILLVGSFDNEHANGVDVSMITLCISVSAIIPFLVTKALTEMEVTKKVNENIDNKIKDTRKRLEQAANAAEGKISIYDSDLSRMISFLMIQKTPDRIWSMSWACRSLKSMMNAKQADSKNFEREYNDLYIAQCISFISSTLEELYCVENIEEFFKNYDKTYESYYTMGLNKSESGTVKQRITANNTLLRLFRDMLTLYGRLDKIKIQRRLFESGIFSDDKDPKYVRLKHLASWFLYSLAEHLEYLEKKDKVTAKLPADIVGKSYALAKENLDDLQAAIDDAVYSYVYCYRDLMSNELPCFPVIPGTE